MNSHEGKLLIAFQFVFFLQILSKDALVGILSKDALIRPKQLKAEWVNPFNAEATFVQIRRMQGFMKTI